MPFSKRQVLCQACWCILLTLAMLAAGCGGSSGKPPGELDARLIFISLPSDGSVSVGSDDGVLPSGTQLKLRNLDSGASETVQCSDDGSFLTELTAVEGDDIVLSVIDTTREWPEVPLTVPSAALGAQEKREKLTVSVPSSGAVTLTGAAGCLPVSAEYLITNLDTGVTAEGTSGLSGEFSRAIAAATGAELALDVFISNLRARLWTLEITEEGTITLKGQVIDADGDTVPEVGVESTRWGFIITDELGEWVSIIPDVTEVSVELSKGGYRVMPDTDFQLSDTDVSVVSLPKTGDDLISVDGKILDNQENPVGDANLILYDGQGYFNYTRTESDGSFQFTDIVDDDYGVLVYAEDFALTQYSLDSLLFEGYPDNQSVISLDRKQIGSEINGTVVDSFGAPVPFALVNVGYTDENGAFLSWEDSTTTDEHGEYTLSDIAPGKVLVRVTSHFYDGRVYSLTLEDDETLQVDALLTRKALIPIDTGWSLEGVVTDQSGNVIEGAMIMIDDPVQMGDPFTDSASDGSFSLSDLPPYALTAFVHAPDYHERFIPLWQEMDQPVRISLSPFEGPAVGDASLEVFVSLFDGEPLEGISVIAWQPDHFHQPYWSATDGSGNALFTGLPSGQYRVEVSHPGFQNESRLIFINDGEFEQLSVTLDVLDQFQGYASLEGSVVDESFQPLSGVKVQVRSYAGNQEFTEYTDENGLFYFDSVLAGPVRLTATRDGYYSFDSGGPVLLMPGINEIIGEIQLFSTQITGDASIYGFVTDPLGNPFPFLEVKLTDSSDRDYFSMTDFSGHYLFDRLEAGVYTIEFFYPGFLTLQDEVTIGAGENFNADYQMEFQRTVNIYGEVLDEEHLPVANAHIYVKDKIQTHTDSEGRYVLHGIVVPMEGEIHMECGKDGVYDVYDLEVDERDTYIVDFILMFNPGRF